MFFETGGVVDLNWVLSGGDVPAIKEICVRRLNLEAPVDAHRVDDQAVQILSGLGGEGHQFLHHNTEGVGFPRATFPTDGNHMWLIKIEADLFTELVSTVELAAKIG